MAPGLVPTAGEHMVSPVGTLDDLPVPVAILLHADIFETILDVSRLDVFGTPRIAAELVLDRSWQEIIDEGFFSRWLVGGGGCLLLGRLRQRRLYNNAQHNNDEQRLLERRRSVHKRIPYPRTRAGATRVVDVLQ